MTDLLDITKMSVSFQTEYETTDAVRDVSITLRPGAVSYTHLTLPTIRMV